MTDIERVGKDKKNDFHGYKYASEQAIKEALHPLLVKHGVIFQVNAKNVRREVFVSNKGGRAAVTDLDLEYSFFDVGTGESIQGTFAGTGDDAADKGTYKAITGAIKYILTSTFLIPTGDDPEVADDKTPTVNYGDAPVKKKWTPKTAPVDKFLHIKSQLKELGHDPRTMKLADELVFGLTGLNITDENINEIEGRLSVKVMENEPKI